MDQAKIIVSQEDRETLSELIDNYTAVDPMIIKCIELLSQGLQKAEIRPQEEMPEKQVQMNSIVTLNSNFGRKIGLKVVMPDFSDFQKGKLSILSTLGTAVLGFSEGDKVPWHFPEEDEWISIEKVDNSELG